MTNIPGSKIVLADSDVLIGLIHEDDLLHPKTIECYEWLKKKDFIVVIPKAILLEASTTISRKMKRPDLSKKLLNDYSLLVQPKLNEKLVMKITSNIFDPGSSKSNTPFDCYLAALAKLNNIDLIFSFDSFYKKQGLKLVIDLIV